MVFAPGNDPGITLKPGTDPGAYRLRVWSEWALWSSPAPSASPVYLDVGSDPLSGTVGIDDREQRRFQGWIELAHAIELARGSGAVQEQEPDRPG
jgi:hypothetical protein